MTLPPEVPVTLNLRESRPGGGGTDGSSEFLGEAMESWLDGPQGAGVPGGTCSP